MQINKLIYNVSYIIVYYCDFHMMSQDEEYCDVILNFLEEHVLMDSSLLTYYIT